MGDFDGKRVFLTGASDGIGAALAAALGRERARVLLFARRADRLAAVAEAVRAGGGEALVQAGDVCRQADLERAVAAARAAWGGLDVVVVNAGVGDGETIDRLDPERLVRVIDVNVSGALRTVAATLPLLLAQGSGHLVGVASPAGFRGLPRGGAYSASKAALTRFLESLRAKARTRGVYVTVVHPGFVRTELTAKNKFRMPFLLEPAQAAEHILAAIRGRRREYVFPWQMAALMGVVRRLPNALYDAVMRRM
jgi:short-subunit dehydrogenase